MGLRFRKSINLGKGAKININKKSVGLSIGTKGVRYSVNSDGRKTTSIGIPGTGLYWTKSTTKNKSKKNKNISIFGCIGWILFFLSLCFILYYFIKK